jgi:hypothetical protein
MFTEIKIRTGDKRQRFPPREKKGDQRMQICFSAFVAISSPGILPVCGGKASCSPGIQSKQNHFIPCYFLDPAAISRVRSNIAHCLTDACGSRNRKKQLKPHNFKKKTERVFARAVSPPG